MVYLEVTLAVGVSAAVLFRLGLGWSAFTVYQRETGSSRMSGRKYRCGRTFSALLMPYSSSEADGLISSTLA
jgi:hypothetical protein